MPSSCMSSLGRLRIHASRTKGVEGVKNRHRGSEVELRNSWELDTALTYALLPPIPG